MIYLAQPYDHPEALVRELRYRFAVAWTATYVRRGQIVYSPIVHSHLLRATPPQGWYEYDLEILARCDELHLAEIPGHAHSKGVQLEIEFAQEKGLTVRRIPWNQVRPLMPSADE